MCDCGDGNPPDQWLGFGGDLPPLEVLCGPVVCDVGHEPDISAQLLMFKSPRGSEVGSNSMISYSSVDKTPLPIVVGSGGGLCSLRHVRPGGIVGSYLYWYVSVDVAAIPIDIEDSTTIAGRTTRAARLEAHPHAGGLVRD